MQQAAEIAVWALLAGLTWRQLRRWQQAAAGDAGESVEAAADAAAEGGAGKAGQGTQPIPIAADSSAAAPPQQQPQQRPQQDAEGAALQAAAHEIVDKAEAAAQRKVHIVGSEVNLPDMSAHLKGKVTVSEAQQADPRLLAAVYDDMALKFGQHGLDTKAVQAMRQYFKIEGPGEAEPLEYSRFPVPLPPGAVRLGVLFFQGVNPALAEMVHQAALELVAALPEGSEYHVNRPSHYHCTVYMASQPHTLRPDPFDAASGGLPLGATPQEQAAASAPDAATLEREIAAFRAAAAASEAPTLEVHRLLLADSGTLLLCSVDTSAGSLAALRGRLKAAFPGGPPKQSTICHASIARLLTPRQLSTQQIARLQAICDAWTERLRGQRFHPTCLHYIQENTFTTVEGPRVELPFKGQQQQQQQQTAGGEGAEAAAGGEAPAPAKGATGGKAGAAGKKGAGKKRGKR